MGFQKPWWVQCGARPLGVPVTCTGGQQNTTPLWSLWGWGHWRMPWAVVKVRDPSAQKTDFQKHKESLVLLELTCRLCPWGGGGQISHCVGGGGGMLDAPRNIIIEILYQAPVCLSWRTWKSYESAECVSGWGGDHKNNHHCCGRQYIMAGLPAWKVNAILLCVCFSEG